MTIPTASSFPESFDNNDNLFLVHDSLRVRLVEDYIPGDTSITVSGDTSKFPTSGLITLTDQCNDPSNRALSFYYSSKTSTTFDGLELEEGFIDISKPKRLTNVTMNVMARHHNAIKDAVIAIQEFVGVSGTVDLRPLGDTMEGRINFLRKLVLRPRAWFSIDRRIGIVPLKVTVTDMSFRDPESFVWDFGDGSISGISNSSLVSTISKTIEHTYYEPGIYDVTLRAINENGEDTITQPNLVIARTLSPDEAVIQITPGSFQTIIDTDDEYLLEHLVPGILKARINTFIDLEVTEDGEQEGDRIVNYTWKLLDDLTHPDSPTTKASYSIGGIYDIKLRVDTEFGAYRTTTLRDAIEIVERENLFLTTFDPDALSSAATKNVTSYEFGLISESFKTLNRSANSITRDYRFLNTGISNYAQQKREFLRNNGFTPRNTNSSGDNGSAVVYWSEGGVDGSSLSSQKIRFMEYEGFTDIWKTSTSFTVTRPWNWVSLNAPGGTYFLFGGNVSGGTNSPTNNKKTLVEFLSLTNSETTLTTSDFQNGADELLYNAGLGSGGDFSVYRSVWSGNNGYIVRNDTVGTFFRLKSFYRTEGTLSDPLSLVRKLNNLDGSSKLEGQIVSLSQGIYFFNNTGEILLYIPTSGTWRVGGLGVNSISFRSLQDSTQEDFDNPSQTLLATSDNDRRAYLSFDYSNSSFLRFNESDLTMVNLIDRPRGEQFVCGVF